MLLVLQPFRHRCHLNLCNHNSNKDYLSSPADGKRSDVGKRILAHGVQCDLDGRGPQNMLIRPLDAQLAAD